MIRAFIGGFLSVFVALAVLVAFALHNAILWGVATAFAFIMGLGFYDGIRARVSPDSQTE